MWERETVNLEKPRDRYASPDFYFGSGDPLVIFVLKSWLWGGSAKVFWVEFFRKREEACCCLKKD